MKKRVWIPLAVLALLGTLVGGLVGFLTLAFPKVSPAATLDLPTDSASIERGRYLAQSVAVCVDCHTPRDWSVWGGPTDTTRLGTGGEKFGKEMGFPGDFWSPNITPASLKDWTDGELMRAVSAGVSKDGRPLFPVMPHPSYGLSDSTDIASILAYIRTLPAVASEVPASKPAFPMNLILRTIPKDPKFAPRPDRLDTVAYGGYIARLASCTDCHTQKEKGAPVPGMDFAGGMKFGPLATGGTAVSSNITPDTATGIGSWTREMFIARFREAGLRANQRTPVGPGQMQTVMPWANYAGMTDEDLGALWAWLRTQPAVKNAVVSFQP
jgi:mono/diheme cytochrome c family protein